MSGDRKRTTVVLDAEDQETLRWVATRMKASDMEAIRRSLRFAREMMEAGHRVR